MSKEHYVEIAAEKIAARLFHNGSGEKAERLVLWKDSTKKNLGGWCKEAVKAQIKMTLLEPFVMKKR